MEEEVAASAQASRGEPPTRPGRLSWRNGCVGGVQTGRARSCRSQTSKQIQSVLREHRETYKRLAAGMTGSESGKAPRAAQRMKVCTAVQ